MTIKCNSVICLQVSLLFDYNLNLLLRCNTCLGHIQVIWVHYYKQYMIIKHVFNIDMCYNDQGVFDIEWLGLINS